jgi:NarL family two-component system sensor histidine kinase YdfH
VISTIKKTYPPVVQAYPVQGIRWFMQLWMGLMLLACTLMAVLFYGLDYIFSPFVFMGIMSDKYFYIVDGSNSSSYFSFLMMMLIHMALHWWSFSFIRRIRWYVLYVIIQGWLSITIANLYPISNYQIYIVISLLLALTTESVTLVKLSRSIIITSTFYLLLIISYLVNQSPYLLNYGFDSRRDFAASLSWLLLSIVPLILFAVGYVAQYIQQVRAHEKTQQLAQELAVAHENIADYAKQVESYADQVEVYAEQVEALTRHAERQRLARDLHDTLAQGLTGLIMQLEVADSHLTLQNPKRAQELIQGSMQSARDTLAASRAVIHELRVATLDLESVLTHEIQQFMTTTGIPCKLELRVFQKIPSELNDPLQHLVREGLTNIMRHAQAHHVWITITQFSSWLDIQIRDDGQGFEPQDLAGQVGHYGILGLSERAQQYRGFFTVTSKPGLGTILQMRLPLA